MSKESTYVEGNLIAHINWAKIILQTYNFDYSFV